MLELRCPRCGKLLGYVAYTGHSDALLLWCKRCKAQRIPAESHEPPGDDDDPKAA